MSKEEVPGENRTVSPGRARERAFATQVSTSAAFSVGTAGEKSVLELVRNLAEYHAGAHFFFQHGLQGHVIQPLVLASGNQDDGGML